MLKRMRSTRLRGLVLLAYALVVAGGLLSSLLTSGNVQVLCLGNGGMMVITVDADGAPVSDSQASSVAVCPLAQIVPAPAFIAAAAEAAPSPLERATRPAVVARLVALTGAPLPPRGPPRA